RFQPHLDYFQKHPGVYFKTTGWIERGEDDGEISQLSLHRSGLGMSYAEMVAKYGEENAGFLREQLGSYTLKYSQYTFIEMGLEPNDSFERCTLEAAAERGWKFEKVQGDMTLIQTLVNGPWDEERFLIIQPGRRVVARYDDGIVGTEEARP
ncbi:MAG: DUF1638 domain-containing protein, partial [Acidobacteria bacterium]|nr:DUF1638 domain-containing protein [Acidobacteriota bacterium]